MQEHLKNAKGKSATHSAEAGAVQVKSVSSTGNIKISLKSGSEGQKPSQTSVEAPASAKQPRVASGKGVDTALAQPEKAKISKPSAGMTPKSLASASAQSDAAFALDTAAAQSSSLKPLGLAAAALGVLALGLGVLQFAGGKSQAVALGDAGAAQPAPTPQVVKPDVQTAAVAAPQTDPVVRNIELVSAAVDVTSAQAQPAPAPVDVPGDAAIDALGAKTVAAKSVVPAVDPDKAAVVAPVQIKVAPTVVAEANVTDPMASAISQAIAKLSAAPTPVDPAPAAPKTIVKDSPAATDFKAASLFKADPSLVEAVAQEESKRAANRPAEAPQVEGPAPKYVPAFPSTSDAGLSPDLMARLTSGTLNALRSGVVQPETPATQAETKAAVSDLYRLISEATAAGKSEAQIAADLVKAHAAGALAVPAGFILADGQVDTQTILSLFIAH